MMASFAHDRSGNIAVMAMLIMVVVTLIAGGAVDLASLASEKQSVQAAADAAALGAVREMRVVQGAANHVQSVATSIASANLKYPSVKVSARLLDRQSAVEVKVSAAPRVFFPGPIGANAKRVTAIAVAEVQGGNVCMIGLSTKAGSTLHLEKSATVTAENCAIYSNSLSKNGIAIDDDAVVTADFICSAGGVKTAKKSNLTTPAVTDCPAISDPLIGRPEPTVSGCDYNHYKLDSKAAATLKPGVYCGGMEINGAAMLDPGVYVIKDGSLKVDKGGELSGEDVGFFFTGDKALLSFEKDSTVSLSAPKTGVMAGLLLFESRSVTPADGGPKPGPPPPPPGPGDKVQEHRIRSDNARNLVGTIYLPRNRLVIDGDKPIADESKYTVILAREFTLGDGPEVVLNTDYALSDVPVPQGVGNKGAGKVRLVH